MGFHRAHAERLVTPACDDPAAPPPRVLLTGATGYVGGRLLPLLEARRVRLRCMVRRPEFLHPRAAATTEIVAGDVCDADSLERALSDIDVAYYMVHAMGDEGDLLEQERRAARNFARAAERCGVRRLVYLGGLGEGPDLSPHLASRHEVGEILRRSGVPTIELCASVVIGSGSLSFELIRALVNRLPIMVTPRWTRVPTQPIAIEDVLAYLLAALDVPLVSSERIEIGGADVVSYGELMHELARQSGLRRILIPVPVLMPRLSSLWLALVTPVYRRIGRHLIEGLRNPTVVHDPSARDRFPSIRPRGVREAIARAIALEDEEVARTRWYDARSSMGPRPSYGGVRFGTRWVDTRSIRVDASPESTFRVVERIGGRTGWYHADRLWRLRGWLDLAAGGVGMRRGRPHPERLRAGDAVDFWRVEACEPPKLLRLQAEMKLPGRAWLQFEVHPENGGASSTLVQTALFDPVGLAGLLYWYSLWPLHAYVFGGMLRALARAAKSTRTSAQDEAAASDTRVSA